jgi:hypothetical protein
MPRLLLIPLATLAIACGTTVDPPLGLLDGQGTLTIQTEKTSYEWEDLSFGGAGIVATVTNTGTSPVYARLGDAFNSAEEQDTLFAVTNSDGRVERQMGDSWLVMPGGLLVEGFKTVVLKPGTSYTLRAHLEGTRVTGTARIRVTWFASAAEVGQGTAHDDTSNTFVIR